MVAKGYFSPQFTAYNNNLYLTSKYLYVSLHGS